MDFEKVEQINNILNDIICIQDQPIRNLNVDTFHLSYILFEHSFELPGLPLDGPEFDQAQEIVRILIKNVPEFVIGTHLLPESRPRKDSQQLHFVKEVSCNHQEYLFIFKVIVAYMGGASSDEITKPASQGISPSFLTDRIYYQARILPINSIVKKNGWIVDFEPSQMKETIFEVSNSDLKRDMWSSVLFDEVDFTELNQKFVNYFTFDTQWSLGKVFSPLVVDYLSLCVNLLNPDVRMLDLFVPYFHECLEAFRENRNSMVVTEDVEFFWSEYYAQFSKELELAKSGNPHWSILRYPNFEWIQGHALGDC